MAPPIADWAEEDGHVSQAEEDGHVSQGTEQSGLLGPVSGTAARRLWPCGAGLLFALVFLGFTATKGSTSLSRFAHMAADVSNPMALSQTEDNCEAYFKSFQDCTQEKYWLCNGDDGSWGYQCCCVRGFGNFSQTKEATTGMIALTADSQLCLDVSTPYAVGEYYTSGPFIVQVCAWGDPNKQFHMPRRGAGQLRWASHPALCMIVEDGKNELGARLKLADCKTAPAEWAKFIVRPDTQQITWAAHDDKCIRAQEVKDGALVSLAHCSAEDKHQQLRIVEPHALPARDEYPRLFCIALMLPFGSELTLMRMQFKQQVGIFQCRDHAVISNVSITFNLNGWKFETDVMPGSLAVGFGGPWHTAFNRDIFLRVWDKIVADNRAWRNSFTVKVDPDTVFFPARLQQLLTAMWKKESEEEAVFLNNCHNFMHGPIEVISKQALGIYKDTGSKCRDSWPHNSKVEDVYSFLCWKMIGIKQVDAYNLLMENKLSCDESSSTRDGRHPCFSKQIAFHPFKTAWGWQECYRRGAHMKWATPFLPVTEVPSNQNHHHS